MQNRRQHFRYAFKPKSYWKAIFHAVDGADMFSAEIVNLSIGGIGVKLGPNQSVNGELWIVTIKLSTQTAPLRIPVERVHASAFRFLPLPNAEEQEEQDRLIWRFIMEEQRRDRREEASRAWWRA
jgi:PilZ domain